MAEGNMIACHSTDARKFKLQEAKTSGKQGLSGTGFFGSRQQEARKERLNSGRKYLAEYNKERKNVGIAVESSTVSMPLPNGKLFRSRKGWKRRDSRQQEACQEQLNNNDALPKVGKRHGTDIENPRPKKRISSADEVSSVSKKYSNESFCGVHDILPDGFYDAGRYRPFDLLAKFETENLCLDMREIILVDRERDEKLDACVWSAQQALSRFKRSGQGNEETDKLRIDDFLRASTLALWVSNHFGGSNKSWNVSTMRRAVAGGSVQKPFVCSCSLDCNSDVINPSGTVPDINKLCEQTVRTTKKCRKSNVVPTGEIEYGVCRHRAILMKYLSDRMDPPIHCELVRGYMDYMPHAWNAIIINKDGKWVRFIVDACRPIDIREEEDWEYFCRYIPQSRFLCPTPTDSIVARNSGLSLSLHEEIACDGSGSVVRRCTLGHLTAAAKHNKLRGVCQIPAWISCNLEGNDALGKDIIECKLISSSSEEELYDSYKCKEKLNHASEGKSETSVASSSYENVSSIICSMPFKSRKGWKPCDSWQLEACQEQSNSSRKYQAEDNKERENVGIVMKSFSVSISLANSALRQPQATDDATFKTQLASSGQGLSGTGFFDCRQQKARQERLNSCRKYPAEYNKERKNVGIAVESSAVLMPLQNGKLSRSKKGWKRRDRQQEACQEQLNNNDALPKVGKRHGTDIDNNRRPSKLINSADEVSSVSKKYSNESFCGVHDFLPDGFYDAGRYRPFELLAKFEKENLCLDMREIILVDRQRDVKLDACLWSADQALSRFKRSGQGNEETDKLRIDDLERASKLALFVSDRFGGSDKSWDVSAKWRAVAGGNVQKPFVCSCSLDCNSDVIYPDINKLCEHAVKSKKECRKSNVVPIGEIEYGVCRHRAILMKYLSDRMDPPIPCELVRGYMDYMPHAWNVIIINRDGKWVRFIVDACRPIDIREEEDWEYFCRYIPQSRFLCPTPTDSVVARNSGLSLSLHEEIACDGSGSVVRRCTLGHLTAAAKIFIASKEQQETVQYKFLGEIRMLGALKKHPCIIDLYGHQISLHWVSSSDGMGQYPVMQFVIAMEYVKGGCLQALLGKLAQEGKKCTPAKLAVFIARDVAYALSELHSKDIIHRDVKSKNVLIDLEVKRSDGSPLVKLCDFDMATPLHSPLHLSSRTCCLAHHGVPSAGDCVGTLRWMAPEMMEATYGLEVDIWSFGCLISELLTLQVPYAGLSDNDVYWCLQVKNWPCFNPQLENFLSESKVPGATQSIFSEEDAKILHILADLFNACTKFDPRGRPTAEKAYQCLSAIVGPTPV